MDTIAPTIERQRHAGETWQAQRHDKRAGTVTPARDRSRLEVDRDAGRITAGECDAGLRYEKSRELASRATVTQSYGQRIAEGTPAGQLAYDDSGVRLVDWYGLHAAAVTTIGRGNALWLERYFGKESMEQLGEYGMKKHALLRARAKLRNILGCLEIHYGMRQPGEP